jgi:hypothetical protein
VYPKILDAYDGAFIIHRQTRGIQGDFKPPYNTELCDEVQRLEKTGAPGIPWGYGPAVFSRDMLCNDFEKNLKVYEWYPDREVLKVVEEAFTLICGRYMRGRVQTLDQIVPRIDKSRSPGYPFNLRYKTKGEVMADEYGWGFVCEMVSQILSTGKCDGWFTVRPGYTVRYCHCYFQTSGKGEMRTVDKLLHPDVTKRKTRTFMAGDFICHCCSLMLYADQNDELLRMSQEKEWSAVGMSPWYGGWNRMAKELLGKVPPDEAKFACEDVGHMEASVNDYFQTVIYRVRNENLVSEFLKPQEVVNLMTWVFQNSVYSYVLDVMGYLLLLVGKNKSGHFNTLTDNTLCLILVLLYRMVFYMKQQCVSSLSDRASCGFVPRVPCVQDVLKCYFETLLRAMGDDSIIANHDWVESTRSVARHLGFDIKLECPVGLLSDSSFLNAGFHRTELMWYMRPNFDKLRASILFNWKSRSWRLTYVKVCAYRMLVFPFERYRVEADAMLNYIAQHHEDDMRRETSMDSKITYVSALASRMSDRDNRWLVSGLEGISHEGCGRVSGTAVSFLLDSLEVE